MLGMSLSVSIVVADRLDGVAGPDDLADRVLLLARLLDLLELLLVLVELERLAQERPHLLEVDRLLEVVERADPHGLDGRLDRRVRRHHDDGDRDAPLAELADELHARDVGHHQVRQDHVRRLPVVDGLEERADGGEPPGGVAVAAQDLGEELSDLGVVVDDVDSLLAHVRGGDGAEFEGMVRIVTPGRHGITPSRTAATSRAVHRWTPPPSRPRGGGAPGRAKLPRSRAAPRWPDVRRATSRTAALSRTAARGAR